MSEEPMRSLADSLTLRVLRRAVGANSTKPMVLNVVARYRQAMEFSSPETMKEYLHEHPGADPGNHWVKTPGEHEKKPEGEKKEEKPESEGESEGKEKSKPKLEVPKSKPMARPKEQARVGVAGNDVPPPPKQLPRLANLREDEKKYEERMNDAFEKNPEGAAKAFLESCEKNNWVFETDAAKNLLPEWSRPDLPKDEKTVHPERAEFRGKYNAVLHQAANAIAKRAFVSRLDEIAKMPEDKRKVLVTSGGVAAGKGSALAAQPDLAKSVSATWDAAGEQNATENEWVLEECKKRGIRPTFLFVHADPKQSWPGVVERAKGIGRMVDAQLFADSYAVGSKNFADFHDKNKDEADFVFGVFQGRGKPAKITDSMPEEALKLDADDIYEHASKYIDEKKDDLPSYIYDGATIGRRAFKNVSDKNASYPELTFRVAAKHIRGRAIMANPKMPPQDKKELDRIRKLFEQGLSEASKDPKKMEELRIKQEQLIKPWEDYIKGWKAPKG
jgi:hypothetical protein